MLKNILITTMGEIAGTLTQFRRLLAKQSSQFGTNESRQMLAENLGYQMVILADASEELRKSNNSAELEKVKNLARAEATKFGIDLDNSVLTNKGIIKR